ncbi:hypothetical protein [Gracilimonas sp. BCB1]|uniref:hypothetical protein n=1 Tax=Gracilimonas sp. BCB1 TaxID=3152362 RepID=UPI0032D8DB66
MKSFLAIISGFAGFLFFEGFARLIITFYHRVDFQFYGISHFPSTVWVVVILLSVLTSTWLVSMLILTVTNKDSLLHAVIFGGVLIGWRAMEFYNSYQSEPLWYFGIVILLHLSGIFLAYQLYTKQHEITDPS